MLRRPRSIFECSRRETCELVICVELFVVVGAFSVAARRAEPPRRAGDHCLFCCYCRTETVRLMHTGCNITKGLKINNEHVVR